MQIWKYHTFGVSVRSKKKENTALHADAPSQGGKPHLGITLCPRTDNSKGSMEMILCVSWTQKKVDVSLLKHRWDEVEHQFSGAKRLSKEWLRSGFA